MGAKVLLTARNKERLGETLNQMENQVQHKMILGDLSMEEDLSKIVDAVSEPLDGLVQCAGFTIPKPFQFLSEKDMDGVMGVNFKAPALLTQRLLKKKKLKKGCSIVFISSISGVWVSSVGGSLYSASKAFYSGVADGYVYDYLKESGTTHKMLEKYGCLNFFMSIGTAISSLLGAYFYGTFSKWTQAHWGHDYGFLILILIEIVFNTAALLLLFALPKLPSAKTKVTGLWEKYKDLFHITRRALRNPDIKYHMFYSGLLAGTTMVFVWSFQPLMTTALIPVSLFGVVYFANHFFRAVASYFLHKTMRFFSLPAFGVVTFIMFVLSFLLAVEMAHVGQPNVWISFGILFFICLTIGFQLTFTLASITRIHTLISSDIRSTAASVNYMIGRMCAGFFLILFKVLLDGVSMQTTFVVAFGVFLFGLYPLWRIVRLPKITP